MKLTRGQVLIVLFIAISYAVYGIVDLVSSRPKRIDTLEGSDWMLSKEAPQGWQCKKIPLVPSDYTAFYPVDFHLLKDLDRSKLRKDFFSNYEGTKPNVLMGQFRFLGVSKIEKPFEGVIIRMEPTQAPFYKGPTFRVWEVFWYVPIKGNKNGEFRQVLVDALSPNSFGESSIDRSLNFGLDQRDEFNSGKMLFIADVTPPSFNRAGIVHVYDPRRSNVAVGDKAYRLNLLDAAGEKASAELEQINSQMDSFKQELSSPDKLTKDRIDFISKEVDRLKVRQTELLKTL